MEVALPAGNTQNVFPILRLMLSSFQCIIWLALASFSEIPVVVRLFLSSNDIRLTVPQVFLILNLNGLFFSYPFFFLTPGRGQRLIVLCKLPDAWNEVRFITSILSFGC